MSNRHPVPPPPRRRGSVLIRCCVADCTNKLAVMMNERRSGRCRSCAAKQREARHRSAAAKRSELARTKPPTLRATPAHVPAILAEPTPTIIERLRVIESWQRVG